MDSRVVVASENPVKIEAVRCGFERMFPGWRFEIEGLSAPSGVSEQPLSDQEALQGAINRAQNAMRSAPQATYWVGVEGGVQAEQDGMSAFAWIVVQSRGMLGKGRTGTFYLPPAIADLVNQGFELGQADDIVFGKSNSKQENGAIGLLTGDVIDRTGLYEQAVILALIPFKNAARYETQSDIPQAP